MTDRLLGPPFNDRGRAIMLAEARKLLGTPWRHQGRTTRGIDCLGFVWFTLARTVLRLHGLDLPLPRSDYGRTPHNGKLREGLILWLGEPVGEPQPCDIVTLKRAGEEAHHVAIVTPHPHHGLGLIHADNGAAGGPRVVEHGWDEQWDRCFVEAFRP